MAKNEKVVLEEALEGFKKLASGFEVGEWWEGPEKRSWWQRVFAS